ncbi:MAG: methylenetetrahydrofolate reductase [NAD(P)H] [Clostridiales bacterium]|nr:methylenetetrahydrofolate reductase [NAD(P)H] [Clostridiales bacterium]
MQKTPFTNESSISFEIFPPKKWESFPNLYETLDALKQLHPSFISCTYGAGGSNSKKTTEIVSYIQNKLEIEGIAHLTCAALTKEIFYSTIRTFQEMGIHNVLALRGDKPIDMTEEAFRNRTYKHPSELIPALKDAGFTVAAACYPEKHYEAPSLEEDIHFLKYKMEQGADFFISQLFFDNEIFYRFMDRADKEGIHVPIEAGIMPITSGKMVGTTINLSGASIPKKMSDLIANYQDHPDDMRKAGIEYAAEQIRELREHGVKNIHIYTMNNAATAQSICSLL